MALFDAQTRRKVAAARRAHGARTQRFGLFQRVRMMTALRSLIGIDQDDDYTLLLRSLSEIKIHRLYLAAYHAR